MFWNKAQYSLYADDSIEYDALPHKQCRRVYAHYILGMSKTEIARAEGVSEKNVRQSINRALRSMEIFLKNRCGLRKVDGAFQTVLM